MPTRRPRDASALTAPLPRTGLRRRMRDLRRLRLAHLAFALLGVGSARAAPPLSAAEASWADTLAPRHLDVLPCGRLDAASEARVAEADGLLPWVNLRAAACVSTSPAKAAAEARLRWTRDPNLAGLASLVLDALPRLPSAEARQLGESLRGGPHASWASAKLDAAVTPSGHPP